MATGKLNGQKAFMSGKLKVSGNVILAQKLQALLKNQAKLDTYISINEIS